MTSSKKAFAVDRGIAVIRLAWLLSLAAAPPSSFAQGPPPDLTLLSLEELMDIQVTSASRKEQQLEDSAAAAFVITREAIRRSGMTTIPDLLRLAPGVNVAQINANRWAVSVRGFNDVYANKLLVLVDGRSVYTRLSAGVFWDAEDLIVDDIERIEVVRGPGAALWGANAVNGVINIVTRSAADTQGGLVRADAGTLGTQGAARYGGALGAMRYRVFAQWTGVDESLMSPGVRADDDSRSVATGFRADWATSPNALTLEGGVKMGQFHALWSNLDPRTAASAPVLTDSSHQRAAHLLARWTHTRANGAALQVQSFVDVARRQEPLGDYDRQAFDVDTQYHTSFGAHQDIVAGVGYRFIDEGSTGSVGLSLIPPDEQSSLVTAFLQDDIALFGNRLVATLGSQAQYDSLAGAGLQPTARLLWKVRPFHRLWVATSRALRTPSFTDLTVRVDYPPVATPSGLPLFVTVLGNRAAQSERFVDLEAGYRIEIGTTASIDITGFGGRYTRLQTLEVAAPIVQFSPSPRIVVDTQFDNQLAATTRGAEVAGLWAPVSSWRLDGSYSAFDLSPHLAASSQDPAAAGEDGSAPRTQWQLRSTWSPTNRFTLGLALFHVGPLDRYQVPAYTRADINAEWRLTNGLSAMVIGQNLLDDAHAEFSGGRSLLTATQIRRGAALRLRWTLR
jgi:iron complex outermembrane receptor protein